MTSIPPLTPDQIEAARQLTSALRSVPFALVGAVALKCQLHLRNKTEDIDFVVATTVESTTALLALPDWTRHEQRIHEWTAPNGVQIDIVPAPVEAVNAGTLVWPDGSEMNLRGMRLVFARSRPYRVADELELLLPPVPVLALLKMISYLDRHARTTKDLAHLVDIFEGYPPNDDERMFTLEQAEAGLSPEEARVQVLARELAGIMDADERECCRAFVRKMREPRHQAQMVRQMLQPREDCDALHSRRIDILEMEIDLVGV
ncbi:MAG: hypothetical protein IPJ34_01555 [Myxococcales bacterium]|nr:hypothetical protein [Myxococcales bacterium]